MATDNLQWSRFRVLESGMPIERFANAGLSFDGRLCFVTDIDESFYFVQDMETKAIIWSSPSEAYPEHRLLDDWVKDGHIEIDQGPAAGNYRLFGVINDYPLLHSEALGVTLHIDSASEEIVLTNNQDQRDMQCLKYQAFSGDWTYTTFSDDYSVIAVIEPYYITFFRRTIDN